MTEDTATTAFDADDEARIDAADAVAARAHTGQVEKGSGAPYVEHPRRVAATVRAAGGTVEQVQAALLHDVLEDAGEGWRPEIDRFGPVVAALVEACSDTVPVAGAGKPPWGDRKTAHLDHLRAGPPDVPADAYLVIAADKLDALDRTLPPLRERGAAFWADGVFKGGRLGTVWYYRRQAQAVRAVLGDHRLAVRLGTAVDELARLAGVADVPADELLAAARTTPWPDGIRAGEGGPAGS